MVELRRKKKGGFINMMCEIFWELRRKEKGNN
jgi:hypothetical protein